MAQTDAVQPPFVRDLDAVAPPTEHDCAGSVLRTYTAAIGRSKNERRAFDAAVHTYLLYRPNVPEQAARMAIARII